jgi:hypothetical protein
VSHEKVKAAYDALNALWAQGGRNRVPRVFGLMIEGYNSHTSSEFTPVSPGKYTDDQTTVVFGRKHFLFCKEDALNVLTAIAHRDRRIVELEHELDAERALRMGTFRVSEPRE